jgi:uncharacterized RDD family membrane protein YckC
LGCSASAYSAANVQCATVKVNSAGYASGTREGREMTYGGFWIRVLAYIIDGILVGIVVGILTLTTDDAARNTVSTIVSWLYFAFMESSARQATFGKSLLNMQVTDEQGQRISFLRATGRHFAKFLSAIILLIGFIMVAFDSRKQGLHDKLASTLVVQRG